MHWAKVNRDFASKREEKECPILLHPNIKPYFSPIVSVTRGEGGQKVCYVTLECSQINNPFIEKYI